jgi:hypothetical protein
MANTKRPQGGVGTAPPVSATPPVPSDRLCARALWHFGELTRRLNESGSASDTYSNILNMTAQVLFEIECLEDVLKEGVTVEIKTRLGREWKVRPEAIRLNQLRAQARALLESLGMSVTARARVRPAPKSGPNAGGAFSEF